MPFELSARPVSIVLLLLLYTQGSVHVPMLFTMYIMPFFCHYRLTLSFTIHLLMTYNYRCLLPPDKISELLHSMQSCMSDVIALATANMLRLNDNNTELIFITSKSIKHLHNLPTSITISNAQIPFKHYVKNLRIPLDCYLIMNEHIYTIARTCCFELHCLTSIHRFLTNTATATLVSAFVLSRIDYCISLLFGSTHDVTSNLQQILNYATRVILCLPKFHGKEGNSKSF